ncbi:hypothetical protein [Actinoplanes sp. N902-109]|uniref:hypothetical protein n=1 Tax=Actinoplanes sp. (strain N902-109) TaxID=649831 RepID=UPI0012FC77CD|nr:hypothetical protein [Actinoplanes sp. N902-109]
MEAHRRYAEEPDRPSWYAGQRVPDQPPVPSPYESGAFRLPSDTGSHAAAVSPSDSGQIRVPVRGPEYPAVRPAGESTGSHAAAGLNDPTSMVPMASRPESVYNARRPISAVLLAVATVVLLVPAVLLLVQATFVDDPSARGVVPAVLLTLGLPLTGTGLYNLASGGRVAAREAWLRAPLAYLPIGLVLLVAAGLGVA